MVAAGLCDEVLVQVAYAIGVAKPVGLYINTFGTSKVEMTDGAIAKKIGEIFDMTPYSIVKRLGLKNPIYEPTASYGHFGRDPFEAEVEVFYEDMNTYKKNVSGVEKMYKKVTFFAWEKLDYVETIQKEFNI